MAVLFRVDSDSNFEIVIANCGKWNMNVIRSHVELAEEVSIEKHIPVPDEIKAEMYVREEIVTQCLVQTLILYNRPGELTFLEF